MAATEALLALPLVLLLALSALQFALVLNARHALAQALHEGARAGSTAHARREAVETGLARGLVGWLYGSASEAELLVNAQRARTEIAVGQAHGWIAWRQLSPHAASFDDWAEPARDADGTVIPGLREIPNDHLSWAAIQRAPRSGVARLVEGAPVGSASGQTLADANLLVLELRWGVPLHVPLIGRLAAGWMRARDGCLAPSQAAAAMPSAIGLLGVGREAPAAAPQPWRCAFLSGLDAAGIDRPRWPVRVSAAVRMQTPGRESSPVATRDLPRPGATIAGGTTSAPTIVSDPVTSPMASSSNLRTANAPRSGSHESDEAAADPTSASVSHRASERAPGFLSFGAERPPPQRLAQVPGACFGP